MYYVYLLGCADRRTYVGCTNNLEERLRRHKRGFIPATLNRRPVSVIAYFAFVD